MGDFLFNNIGKICVTVILLLFLALFLIAKNHNETYNRLMKECLNDKKEYECYSMLRSNRSTTIIPVPIKVGR